MSLLLGLLLSAVQQVRSAAARAQCANNLRQIGTALHGYHDTHDTLPPGVSVRGGKDPYPFMSWHTRLLPFVEQDALWRAAQDAYKQDRFFLDNPPHTGLGTVVAVYNCPADGRTRQAVQFGDSLIAFTGYLGVEGTNAVRADGVLYLDSRTRFADITDGTSSTLLVGERPPSADLIFGWWYAGHGQSMDGSGDMVLGVREKNTGWYGRNCPLGPYQFGPGRVSNQCDAFHFWSLHSGGAHFVFADGSLHFLRYSANALMPALATRSGGEAVADPD